MIHLVHKICMRGFSVMQVFKDTQENLTGETPQQIDPTATGYAVATLVANLEGDVTGDVAGNLSGIAQKVTITDSSANTNFDVVFNDASNDLLEDDGAFHYNPSTGLLTSTAFAGALTGNVTGNVSGTAATVTGAAQSNITSVGTLTSLTATGTASNIITRTAAYHASSHDGSLKIKGISDTYAITLVLDADGDTTEGTDGDDKVRVRYLNDGTPKWQHNIGTDQNWYYDTAGDGSWVSRMQLTSTGTLSATAFSGPLTGDVTGNVSGSAGSATGNAATATLATTVTITDNAETDETVYPVFVDGATGTQGLETETKLSYKPDTGILTSIGFAGALTGDVTGNVSGTAATVTGAAQSNITSLGTLTALTGGTGDLIWDTNTLVVDSSANRVGIGTTSPSVPLHVSTTLTGNDATTFVGAEVFRVDSIDDGSSSGGPGFSIRLESTNDHNSPNYEKVIMGDGGSMRVKNIHGNYGFSEWWLGGTADGKKPIMSLISGGSTSAGEALDGILQLYSTTSAWAANTFSPTNNTTKVKLDAGGDSYFTGGNVGIGTTSPEGILQIDKTSDSTFANTNTLGGSHLVLKTHSVVADAYATLAFDVSTETDADSIGASISALRDTSAGSTVGNHDTNLVFATNDAGDDGRAERMRITHDGLVGIGITSPSGNLHISATQPRLYLSDSDEGTGTGDSLLITKSGTISYIYDRDASSKLYLGANDDSDILVIDGANARVGIGTTSPGFALDVTGTFQAQGDHDGNVIIDNTGTDQVILASHTGSGTPVPWDIREDSSTDNNGANYGALTITRMNMAADGAGSNIHFRAKRYDSSTPQEIGGIGATIDTGLSASAEVTGSLHFYTTTATATLRQEKMTIKSSGNVGIGTTNPTFASGSGLHITNSTQANVRLEDDAGEFFDLAMQQGDVYLINRVADGFLSLRTNSTERMRILANGNVGIGTAAPIMGLADSIQLNVHNPTTRKRGILQISSGSSTNADVIGSLWFSNDDNSDATNFDAGGKMVAAIEAYVETTDSNGGDDSGADLVFITKPDGSGIAERMRITSAGKVGIGITAPTEALHIRSSSDHPLVLENDQNASYVGIQFSDHAGGSYAQKGELRFNHADGSSEGSGASFHFTTTESDLSIVGGKFISAVGSVGEPGFGFSGDVDNGMFHPATNEIAFTTAGAEAVRLDASGNVGIGTTDPDAKLHVEGSVLIDAFEAGAGAGLFFREGFLNTNQPSITVQDHSGAHADGLAISAYDGISFRLNAVEKARFDSNGNLGI